MFSPADAREPQSAPRTGRSGRAARPRTAATARTAPGRTASRTRRAPGILLAAALSALVLTGCSSGAAKPAAAPASSSAKPPSAPPVRYAALPSPCSALDAGTVKSLVPGAKNPKGTAATAGSAKDRGGCAWNGLNGYQYRYLDIAFQRYDNVTGGSSGEDQAASSYTTAVSTTQSGARDAKGTPATSTLPGVGDQATLISWTTSKDHDTYLNVTVIARSANAVLSVDYIGAGLQGDHKPKASDLDSGAKKAATAALASLG